MFRLNENVLGLQQQTLTILQSHKNWTVKKLVELSKINYLTATFTKIWCHFLSHIFR
jgi:hypothetical protein